MCVEALNSFVNRANFRVMLVCSMSALILFSANYISLQYLDLRKFFFLFRVHFIVQYLAVLQYQKRTDSLSLLVR